MSSFTQAEIKKQIENTNHLWYVVSVIPGQENIVVENLQERVKKQELDNSIVDYYLPTVLEKKISRNTTKMIEKKLYPGYVFVKSVMNDKVWYVIRNTPGVRIIVGAETRPIPLTEKEFTDMVKQVEQRNTRADLVVPYRVGDIVMLKDGSFSGTKGVVHEIDAEKMHLVVNIEILGRLTPVVTELDKVELSK